jgi:hypothetical protein
MKRIVLFVEGEGEADAVPKLVKRLLSEQNAWDAVSLDENTFRVGEVECVESPYEPTLTWDQPLWAIAACSFSYWFYDGEKGDP